MRAVAPGLVLVAAAVGLAQDIPAPRKLSPESELVAVQRGNCPIILSAPHGGTAVIPGVPARKGEGLAKGGAGFTAGRDVGTEELAYAVAAAVEKKLGRKPYFVVAKFHRKYLDANRPPEIAYEDAKAKPTYDAYRDTLAEYCRQVRKEFGRGLLLDIHGQGSQPETVIRGTKDGLTVTLLRQRYGEAAHNGPHSFFGLLAAAGCKVAPADLKGKEVAGLNGGHIVQTYGSHQTFAIDAMQLEFGGTYRTPEAKAATAEKVATAVQEYAQRYLGRDD